MRINVLQALLLLLSSAVLCTLPACAPAAESAAQNMSPLGESSAESGIHDWIPLDKLAEGFQPAVENEYLALYVDAAHLHISLYDKSTGITYNSSPGMMSTRDAIVQISYMSSSREVQTMNSFNDCLRLPNTQEPNFTLAYSDSAKTLLMNIGLGLEEQRRLLPEVFPERRFRELLGRASAQDRQQIESLYQLWSNDDPDVSEQMRQTRARQYPALLYTNLYTKRAASIRVDRQLEAIFRSLGYTHEQFEEDQVYLGLELPEPAMPFFRIPLMLKLDGPQLTATVDASAITYDQRYNRLLSLTMLPFFGASGAQDEGFVFVPDGSGMLMRFSPDESTSGHRMSRLFYGPDSATVQLVSGDFQQNLYFPVYGIATQDSNMFAVVENGEAGSALNVELQFGNPFSTAYVTFAYTASDFFTFEVRQTPTSSGWRVANRNVYTGDFTIRYFFSQTNSSAGGEAYMDMARTYREYLLKTGTIVPGHVPENPAVYLNMLGSCDSAEMFLWLIPVKRKTALTRFSDAQDFIAGMKDSGAGDMVVRYTAFANGGLGNRVNNRSAVERVLGGSRGFRNFSRWLDANGIPLYPGIEPMYVYQTRMFDGFSFSADSPRKLDNTIASVMPWSIAYNLPAWDGFHYLVSPRRFLSHMESFFSSYRSLGVNRIALGGYGNVLYADYNERNGVNLDQSKGLIAQTLAYAADQGGLVLDGANVYTLAYAERLMNAPVVSSGYFVQSDSIPFFSMVLHGLIPFAAEPLNLGQDMEHYLLRCVEAGADLQFTLAMHNLDRLKETEFPRLYSVNAETWRERILAYNRAYRDIFSGIKNRLIIDHEIIAPGVRVTVFEGGRRVYVNYTDEDIVVEGVTIPANYFAAGSGFTGEAEL